MKGKRIDNRADGLKYITRQLEWYRRFSGRRIHRIYMSDHGEGMINGRAYIKGRTNIPFIIEGSLVPSNKEDRFYSHKDTYKLIKYLISENSKDWEDVFCDYILYQNVDYMNKGAIMSFMYRWITGLSKVDMANLQIRGIRTHEDIYVKYAIGKECYFRTEDEDNNLIHDEKWQDRINDLRKLCGDEFIDISKDPYFEHSQMLYDYINLMPEETIEW